MALLLLGPSTWAAGYTPPELPSRLHDDLPYGRPAGAVPTPLEIRIALANHLGRDGHPVVVMETRPDHQGEPRAAKFSRLVRKEGAVQFALYWPFGARRTGLDVEIGFLLERLARREIRSEDVRRLVEDDGAGRRAGAIEPGPDGPAVFVSLERGARTRYYADLVTYRAILATWADYGELLELLENFASD